MKNFSSAYYNSRKEVKEDKRLLVEQEHAKIVAAMKKTFAINNFSELNETERKSYRSMLNEMWNKETGLTEKGIKFLTEAAAPLTKDSTPEQLKKAFQRDIKANIKDYLIALGSENSNWEDAAKAKKRIENESGQKLTVKDCKTWLYEIVNAYVVQKVKGYKF